MGGTVMVEEGGRRVSREGVPEGRVVGMAIGEVGMVMEVGEVGMGAGVGMGRVIDPPISELLGSKSKLMLSLRLGGSFWTTAYAKFHWWALLWAGLVLALASKMGICASRFWRGSSSNDPTTSGSESSQWSTSALASAVVSPAASVLMLRLTSKLESTLVLTCES